MVQTNVALYGWCWHQVPSLPGTLPGSQFRLGRPWIQDQFVKSASIIHEPMDLRPTDKSAGYCAPTSLSNEDVSSQ